MTASAPPKFSLANMSFDVLPSFDFHQRTRLIFGRGTFEQLGDLAKELAGRRILLVTDFGLRQAGHSDRAQAILKRAGLDLVVFDQVSENPTTEDIERCAEFAEPAGVDLIIGLGGGSCVDCAKGVNFLLTNGGRMQDYRGIGKAKLPMLPMIAVPTTSGTGSEAQSFAVVADAATHMKMACGDVKAACRVAVLDPDLTVSMPRFVTAASGIDALTHAVESYVTTKRNTISQMFARQAWGLLVHAFPVVLRDPSDVVARGRMQLGAFLAGAAIENSMLGATHASANPLTAQFNMIHGVAVGLMLPHVVRWNSDAVGSLYRDLAIDANWANHQTSPENAAGQLADGFTELLKIADLPVSIQQAADTTPDEKVFERLSDEAAQQWTGAFNPRKMDAGGFLQLYRNAL